MAKGELMKLKTLFSISLIIITAFLSPIACAADEIDFLKKKLAELEKKYLKRRRTNQISILAEPLDLIMLIRILMTRTKTKAEILFLTISVYLWTLLTKI